jgi:uncharacterized membrane protein YfcA
MWIAFGLAFVLTLVLAFSGLIGPPSAVVLILVANFTGNTVGAWLEYRRGKRTAAEVRHSVVDNAIGFTVVMPFVIAWAILGMQPYLLVIFAVCLLPLALAGMHETHSYRTATHVPAPAWYPDPMWRHELRWWNGVSWTDDVSDRGERGSDPVTY